MAVSEKGYALTGLLGRGRGRGSASPLVKQQPNDATYIVVDDLLFTAGVGSTYTLTAQGGAYALTGASAVFSRTYVKPQISSAVALNLGTSATPGAQSITVPADAQVVVVLATTYTSGGLTLSITSDFASTFTISTAGDGSDKCHVAYATVTSAGSKTITPTWSAAVTDGPIFYVAFISNVNTGDFLREAKAYNVNTQGSTTSTTISSSATDLVLAMERESLTTTSPTTMSGFTSVNTSGINNIGTRLQYADSPGSSTTTLQSSGTDFPGFSAISIKAIAVGAYTLTAQGGAYSLVGASAILQRSKVLTASGGSYTLTGANANLVKGRVLTAQAGTYTLTGASATLLRSKYIAASGGSYALAGAAATITKSKLLVAQGGVYNLTGSSAVITYTAGSAAYTLTCQGGTYTLTGASASINRNRNLAAQGGAYTISGTAANLYKSKVLVVQGGAYNLSGSSAIMLKSKKLVATGGSYTLTGASATLLRSKVLVASGGVYSLTGQSAILSRNRMLVASSGSYTYQGSSAILTKSSVGGYPAEADVLLGVVYGPSGEYTGTLDIGKKFRIDIATGNIVMIIDEGKVMSL